MSEVEAQAPEKDQTEPERIEKRLVQEIRSPEGILTERYVLEIFGEKDKWSIVDRIVIESCWYTKWRDSVCREIMISFPHVSDKPREPTMEILVRQYHSLESWEGDDFSVWFVSPVFRVDNTALPRSVMDFIGMIGLGAVNEENLLDSLRSFLKGLREYMGIAAKTYISL